MKPHRGTLILVLGILGLIVCAFCAPAAWIMGKADLKEMDAGQMDPEGRDVTNIGKILGIIGTVLMILGCFVGLLIFVLQIVLVGAGAMAQ